MTKTESKISPIELSLEILLYPVLFIMPYFTFKEIIIFFNNPNGNKYIWLFTILATLAVTLPYYIGKFHDPRRPLSRPLAMFLAEATAFSTYFVIFRSFESFRLPQQTIMQCSVSFIVFLFFLSALLKGRIELRRTPFNFPILLITILCLLSFIVSPNRMVSFKEFMQYAFVVLNFFLVVSCLDSKKHYKSLVVLIIVVMAIEALIGVAQHFGLNELIKLGNNLDPFSTLGNKNYVAEMLAMTIPFGIAACVAARRAWLKALILLCIIPMLFVVLVAITRGSWIGLMGSMLFFIFFALDRLSKKKLLELGGYLAILTGCTSVMVYLTNNAVSFSIFNKTHHFSPPAYSYSSRFMSIANIIEDVLAKSPAMLLAYGGAFLLSAIVLIALLKRRQAKILSVAIIAIIMAFFAFGGSSGSQMFKGKPASEAVSSQTQPDKTNAETQAKKKSAPAGVVEDSIVSRKFIWGGSLEMIRHHKLGVGMGAFKIEYLTMLKSYLERSGRTTIPGLFKDVNAKEAHCEYLHLLAELGPLAPVLILFFIYTLFRYFMLIFYKSDNPATQLVALGSFSGLVSIGLSATLGFPFHICGPAMISGVFMALLVFSHDRTFGVETTALYLPGLKGSKPPRTENAAKEKKKSKGKKGKRKRDKQPAAPAPAPDLTWKKHWFILPIDAWLGLFLVVLSALLFVFVSTLSINWQLANIHMKTANFLAKAGQTDRAADLYDTTLELDRYNGDIHLFRGMFFQKQGKKEIALEEFLEAKKYYDLPQIALDLGAIYFEKGPKYYDKAEASFRESLAVYPNYAHPRYNLGLISYQKGLVMMNDPTASRAEVAKITLPPKERKEKAIQLLKSAATMFTEAIELNPRLVTASFKLALTYEKLNILDPSGDYLDQAIRWYTHTTRLNPGHADAHYNLGLLYAKTGAEMTARADRLLGEGKKDEADALRKKADQTTAKSAGLFDKAIRYNPRHTRALNNRGNQLFNEGNVEKALQMYQAAIRVDPNYVNAQLNIALAFLHMKEFDKALDYLTQLRKKPLQPPHKLKVAYMLGTCYINLGRVKEADDVLSKTVGEFRQSPYNASPEYVSAAIRLAETGIKLKRYADVITLLDELLARPMPAFQEAESLLFLGQAYYVSGNKREAANAFSKLTSKHPNSPYAKNAKPYIDNL